MTQDTTRTIETRALGTVEISEQQVLEFSRGLFGFETVHEYALLDSGSPPFYWLQSTERADLAFLLINPYVVVRDYVLDIAEDDLAAIGSPSSDDLLVFAVVTIPADRSLTSCNLQGPIIVHRQQRLARQAISLDLRWKVKHYLATGEAG
jgi:flagellar assembly factor FliW